MEAAYLARIRVPLMILFAVVACLGLVRAVAAWPENPVHAAASALTAVLCGIAVYLGVEPDQNRKTVPKRATRLLHGLVAIDRVPAVTLPDEVKRDREPDFCLLPSMGQLTRAIGMRQ